MNLRLFSVVLMASAIPLSVSAGSTRISLTEGDFISAEKITRDGGSLVSVKLSKSGKAKLKKLKRASLS